MSLIGTNSIGKLILGSTEMAKAYLGSQLVFQSGSGPTPPAPYDSQIEFIQSTGVEYIDTGINLREKVVMTVDMSLASNNSATRVLFGAFSDASTYPKFQIYINSSNKWAANGNTAYYTNSGITVNGNVVVGTRYSPTVTAVVEQPSDWTIYIFARNHDNGAGLFVPDMKVYSCQVSRGGILVRDFIPVRVGQVGYLYDNVSGNLFGNASGQGSFILGSDI